MSEFRRVSYPYAWLTIDKEASASYVSLAGGQVSQTLAISDSVNVDYDDAGCVVGIEILRDLQPFVPAKAAQR